MPAPTKMSICNFHSFCRIKTGMQAATFFLAVVGIYWLIGLIFATAFSVRGAQAIDESVVGAPIGFRLLIIPAAIALWPVLAHKWFWQRRTP